MLRPCHHAHHGHFVTPAGTSIWDNDIVVHAPVCNCHENATKLYSFFNQPLAIPVAAHAISCQARQCTSTYWQGTVLNSRGSRSVDYESLCSVIALLMYNHGGIHVGDRPLEGWCIYFSQALQVVTGRAFYWQWGYAFVCIKVAWLDGGEAHGYTTVNVVRKAARLIMNFKTLTPIKNKIKNKK